MALGVDILWALEALELDFKLVAAVPFIGQESRWPRDSRDVYNKILEHKNVKRYVVFDGAYAPWKMQGRNQWMVDNCTKLVAVWNGDQSGGTYNCVKYAQSIDKPIIFVDFKVSD